MSDRLAVLPQYLLPKQALTQLMGKLAGLEGGGQLGLAGEQTQG